MYDQSKETIGCVEITLELSNSTFPINVKRTYTHQDIPISIRVYHHISLIPDRVNLSSVYLPTTVGSYISLQWQRSRRAEE